MVRLRVRVRVRVRDRLRPPEPRVRVKARVRVRHLDARRELGGRGVRAQRVARALAASRRLQPRGRAVPHVPHLLRATVKG